MTTSHHTQTYNTNRPFPEMDQIFSEALKEATQGVGKLNILVAGKTGVGKSTLINSVFRGNLANTGSGKPVTQEITEISKPGHPLTIIDSKGLEAKNYQKIIDDLEREINRRSASEDPDMHIHAAWICIQASGARVEEAEQELCRFLDRNNIPVIIAVTKSKKNDPFTNIVQKLIPIAKNTISIRAIEEYLEEADIKLPPFGLDELIEATANILPASKKRAYANALNTKNKRALKEKKNQAEIEVNAAAAAAGVAAATPIPFSDAFLLVPIQVGMLAKVGTTYGMELSTTAITTLVSGALGGAAATVIGRMLVTAALKFIPGVGSIAGGAFAATTAVTLTKTLGNSYIAVLHEFCESNPGKPVDIQNITQELKKRMSL